MSARALLAAAALLLPTQALAGNIARCEAVIMDFMPDDDGGGAEIASFRDATDFMVGIYDDATEPVLQIDGYDIRAIMCQRQDLMPDEDDYKILATGLMLSLSQDFDTNESEALSLIWLDGRFRYKWSAAEPMDEAMEDALKALLADFSARDHGLGDDEVTENDVEAEDAAALAEDSADVAEEVEADDIPAEAIAEVDAAETGMTDAVEINVVTEEAPAKETALDDADKPWMRTERKPKP